MLCLATFETTYMALKFERAGRKAGLDVRIVPVPRELSSSCGFACRFPCHHRETLSRLAEFSQVDVAGYHEISTP